MVRFQVLGSLDVRIDGVNCTPRGPKIKKACALLLLRANQIVDAEGLAEELWDGVAPGVAVSTLRTHVYHLRRSLGPAAGRLQTCPGGYLLNALPGELDAQVFTEHVNLGARLLRQGDAEAAAVTLRSALGLWRGPALAGLPVGRALAGHLVRLHEARARALELRIEADLLLGAHRMLIAELRELVAVDPLNEWAQGRLMEALRRSGHRAAALAAFRQARQRLDEEVGLAPSPELQRLHQEILSDGMAA